MKCSIHNHDMILKTNVENGGVEIGSIPKGVGLERMRWTGSKLVDLNNLSEIWCEYTSGGFRLHSIQVPNSQLVQMQYRDRKKLYNDSGVYRVKSNEMVQNELNFQYRRSDYEFISDQMDILLKYYENKTDLTDELQDLINDWRSVKEKYPKVVEKVSKI